MAELSRSNKFLIVQATVILTEKLDSTIVALDKYFEQANLKAIVISGQLSVDEQLDVIRKHLVVKGLAGKYESAMVCNVTDKDGEQYVWQKAWSNLLNIGVTISPPLAAMVLMDYAKDDKNMNGKIMGGSPQIKGEAFIIGNSGDNIHDELEVLKKAVDDGILIQLSVECENNAIVCIC